MSSRSANKQVKQDLIELGNKYRRDLSYFDGRLFRCEVENIASRIVDDEESVKALEELGAQYRADWCYMDGRSIQSRLHSVAFSIRTK